jgi:hypothetical protein
VKLHIARVGSYTVTTPTSTTIMTNECSVWIHSERGNTSRRR